MGLEPGHQHLTNGEGQVLSQVMRHVHGKTEYVQGVGEDVHLAHVLQSDIAGLTDPMCNCSHFVIVGCSKTSCRPVIVEVPLVPEVEGCN
jgi:hypothetical protein